LALGVLRRLPGLLQPVLAALLLPSVASQHAFSLERGAGVRIDLEERPGDAMAKRPGLAADPTPVEAGDHVELLLLADRRAPLGHDHAVGAGGEVLLQGPAVELELPRPGHHPNPGPGLLAPARSVRSILRPLAL